MTSVFLTHTGAFTAFHGHGGTLAEEVHPHHFTFQATFYGPVNTEGYLIDFRELAACFNTLIVAPLSQQNLGNLLPNPTTEMLAVWIFDTLKTRYQQLTGVQVAEDKDRWITYKGEHSCP